MFRRSFFLGFFGLLGFFGFFPAAEAAGPLTYRHRHFIYTVTIPEVAAWKTPNDVWTFNGAPVEPPASVRVDGDVIPPLPDGFAKTSVQGWNRDAIRETLRRRIAVPLERAPGSVTIGRGAEGKVTFDGVGMLGRSVDLEAAVDLTIAALDAGVPGVTLPVAETQPTVTVTDDDLREQGIKEVVAFGESDFTGSTVNRKHNIGVGMDRFNGHVIPKDTIFSFNEVLGPVNGSTGYRKELTILGDKTLPDFGGGLCQVSTTAYRGLWEAGFPVEQRRNHSFAVHYYSPQGSDATIYPPNTDVKIANDGPSSLLIQTYREGVKAYFIYYGTKSERTAEVIGPYLWNFRSPPPKRIEETTDLPVGEQKKVGEAVSGMNALWVRVVNDGDEEKKESVLSVYEARPLFYQVGVASLAQEGDIPAPDWIDVDPAS